MPFAAAAFGPRVAAPLLLVVDGVTTLDLLPGAWRTSDRCEVGTMALGAVLR